MKQEEIMLLIGGLALIGAIIYFVPKQTETVVAVPTGAVAEQPRQPQGIIDKINSTATQLEQAKTSVLKIFNV